MKLFRKILFWTHLVVGITGGLVIAMLAFTGATMAFEPQILAALERDARVVTPPSADAPRLPIDDLVKKLREKNPEARPQSITVSADPTAATILSLGREESYYANPYTGELRQPSEKSKKVHDFIHLMESCHRWLTLEGDQRPIGKGITGAANLIFFALLVSGIYLWWPRNWSWRAMRPSVWFVRSARGKARDWNWHNVIGLWSAPILLITTLTGAIMSYTWANNLLFRAVGSTPPPPRGANTPPANNTPQFEIVRPEGARPLGFDALLVAAKAEAPADWSTIAIRTAAMQRGRGGQQPGQGQTPGANNNARPAGENATAAPAAGTERPAGSENRPRGEGRGNAGEGRGPGGGGGRGAPQPVSVMIRADSLSSPLQLNLNPFTAEKLVNPNATTSAEPDLGRRLRTMVKPLHTGMLGGWWHQTIVFFAAIGTLVLVYTGFALAFRRFFKRRKPAAAASSAPATPAPASASAAK
ncbi:MAG: PepSY-associated TM helix domain-containing protein [Nibricoccus sp.]